MCSTGSSGGASPRWSDYYRAQTGRPLPEAFRADLRSLQATSFAASLKPIPHIVEVLSTLDRPYCLASSSDRERIELSLAVTRLDAFFERPHLQRRRWSARQAGARPVPRRGGEHGRAARRAPWSSRTASTACSPARRRA